MPSDDPRRVVVIDPATDNVTTIIGKASAAPGIGGIRQRALQLFAFNEHSTLSNFDDGIMACLRVILGDSEAPS